MTADRVFVAPELRTRETAAGLGIVGVVDSALRDVDYAAWRGLAMTSRQPGELTQWLTDPAAAPDDCASAGAGASSRAAAIRVVFMRRLRVRTGAARAKGPGPRAPRLPRR